MLSISSGREQVDTEGLDRGASPEDGLELIGTREQRRAAIDRIIRDYPPRLRLEQCHFPEFSLRPIRYPILYWGFPMKKGYLRRFAERHKLSSPARPALPDARGQDTLRVEFTPEGLKACGLPSDALDTIAEATAVAFMAEETGLHLKRASPVSRDYHCMVVVLDNRRVQSRPPRKKVFWPGVEKLRPMMNEEDYDSEPMWYWSWENAFP